MPDLVTVLYYIHQVCLGQLHNALLILAFDLQDHLISSFHPHLCPPQLEQSIFDQQCFFSVLDRVHLVVVVRTGGSSQRHAYIEELEKDVFLLPFDAVLFEGIIF